MIIVDLSQVAYSTLMVQLGFDTKNVNVEESMLRHMIINCLRSYNVAYKDQYGEMIIACDNTSWRNNVFPYYKARRKKNRSESSLDWSKIFPIFNKIKLEIKEYLPYKVLDIDLAEADDIIYTLVARSDIVDDKILILSGDKDFIQLHRFGNVKQYDPTRKKWISHDNPEEYLLEHIIKGDSGDGIPNVLSDDDSFVLNKRQKPITVKQMNLAKQAFEENKLTPKMSRNVTLIDLSNCPNEIQDKVIEEIKNQSGKDRSKMLSYFMNNKLKLLTENISDF